MKLDLKVKQEETCRNTERHLLEDARQTVRALLKHTEMGSNWEQQTANAGDRSGGDN